MQEMKLKCCPNCNNIQNNIEVPFYEIHCADCGYIVRSENKAFREQVRVLRKALKNIAELPAAQPFDYIKDHEFCITLLHTAQQIAKQALSANKQQKD